MRRLTLAALLALLALPGAAHAAYFPAEVIDGPNGDIVEVGEVDIARDGLGGVVYVRNDGGVPHVFLSRFTDGVFQPPERLDGALPGASSQPRIAVSDGGRMAIAFVNDGSLFVAAKASSQPAIQGPVVHAQGGVSNPSIDMSINGASYVSYTQNGDVRVSRATRDTNAFQPLPAPVDVDPARVAGTGERLRSQIAVSADGTGLVTWGENGPDGRTHVYARRLFELRLSTAPQDLTMNELDGQAAGDADSPDLDMEDDSSFAQVVFRQATAGGQRVIMRRLVGSAFDPPAGVDAGFQATSGRVDLTGRGEGLFAVSGAGGPAIGGALFNNRVRAAFRFDGGNAIEPRTDAAVGENENGAVTWMQGTSGADATVHSRYLEAVENPRLQPEVILSRPEFGPVLPSAGLDTASSRRGDMVAVFVQNGGDGRRLVAGLYDTPPTRVAGSNSQSIRRLTRLSWAPSLNLFGPVTYRIVVDGRQIAETTQTQVPIARGQIRDGNHTWQIFLRDRRGQEVRSRTRRLRVDNTPPLLSSSLSRRGRVVTVRGRGRDSRGRLKSGMGRVVVDWGDGRLVRVGRNGASKRYSRSGRYTVRVKAIDRAGNERVHTRRVQIG
jgi:hypothetical protein